MKGTVKWFNDARGFGYFTTGDSGKDVYCDQAALDASGLRSLPQGQQVEFDVQGALRGPRAVNVRLVAGTATVSSDGKQPVSSVATDD